MGRVISAVTPERWRYLSTSPWHAACCTPYCLSKVHENSSVYFAIASKQNKAIRTLPINPSNPSLSFLFYFSFDYPLIAPSLGLLLVDDNVVRLAAQDLLVGLGDGVVDGLVAQRVLSSDCRRLVLEADVVAVDTLKLAEDAVDSAGAAAAGHGDLELVGVQSLGGGNVRHCE